MSKQTIYERLVASGCTPTGALALMGNWACESNLEACRVQGDFQTDRQKSRDYASRIDNGRVSDDEWCWDGKGWGLAQWTFHTRKAALLQFCRRRSASVASEEAQVDFAVSELQTGYRTVWADLTTCKEEELYKVVELVCTKYEQPAYNNIQQRANAAVKLRDELANSEPEKPAKDEPTTPFWPPRTLCYGMKGADVTLLQALLLCHDYNCGGCTGIFNNATKIKVLSFQAESGLETDGIAGPKTFRALGVTV